VNETRVPDRVGVELGWRVWAVQRLAIFDEERGRYRVAYELVSPQRGHVWPMRREIKAVCLRALSVTGHGAPALECNCGIHAARELLHALQTQGLFSFAHAAGQAPFWIAGRLAGWGKIVPGTRGFRAERAYPEALVLLERTVGGAPSVGGRPQCPRVVAEELADLYGVPLAHQVEDLPEEIVPPFAVVSKRIAVDLCAIAVGVDAATKRVAEGIAAQAEAMGLAFSRAGRALATSNGELARLMHSDRPPRREGPRRRRSGRLVKLRRLEQRRRSA
jgi:hypothetical protein